MPLPESLKIHVILAPDLITESQLKGSLCAVIDVLRATSTLIVAFNNGVKEVYPFRNPGEAREFAATLPVGSYVLGGEVKAVKIPGFDLGNSPVEYNADTIQGQTLLFSTSNGTPTLQRAFSGTHNQVFVASLLNIGAVCRAMKTRVVDGSFTSLAFICSGRLGKPSSEDTFCAGLGVQKLSQTLVDAGITPELTDGAFIAAHFAWSNKDKALNVLAGSEAGRSLLPLGFKKDIELAAEVDKYGITPVFNGRTIEKTLENRNDEKKE